MARFGSSVAAVAVAVSSCATVTYEGPRRPRDEVAVIETDDAAIDGVDDRELDGVGKVEVLPGQHAIATHLTAWSSGVSPVGGGVLIHRTSGSVTVCVNALPGRTYLLRPALFGDEWGPEIIDETTTRRVAMRAPGGSSGCR